jgi:Tfp pilus assembly protein PilF
MSSSEGGAMKRIIVAINALFLLCSLASVDNPAHAANLPLNQIPMYGEVEKTEAMKHADADFIAEVQGKGFTREAAAKEVVRTAWVYFQKGDMVSASMRFNQAWLLDPENGDTYHGFALVTLQRDREVAAAERYFRLATSKQTVSANAYVDYGRYLSMLGRLDESMEQLQKSLQISTIAYNARSNMAFVYYRKGDFSKACDLSKEAKANGDQLEPGFLEDMCSKAKVN